MVVARQPAMLNGMTQDSRLTVQRASLHDWSGSFGVCTSFVRGLVRQDSSEILKKKQVAWEKRRGSAAVDFGLLRARPVPTTRALR